ncbi:hypothetical protein Ancab_018928 [Ancistrocladus abbreviatus]
MIAMSSSPPVLKLPLSLSFPSARKSFNPINRTPLILDLHVRRKRKPNLIFTVSNCHDITTSPSSSSNLKIKASSILTSGLVSLRLKRLVSEFQSLPEPIDRVKRILDYAMVLPQVDESIRLPENRVAGCAAQVWLLAKMDEFGRMRFWAYSDSEITKGFCSCLIYLLDGASAEEIVQVKAEDLVDVNVGVPVRSRVNSWQNVFTSMQERTKALIAARGELVPVEPFPSFLVEADSKFTAKGKVLVP